MTLSHLTMGLRVRSGGAGTQRSMNVSRRFADELRDDISLRLQLFCVDFVHVLSAYRSTHLIVNWDLVNIFRKRRI